MQMTRCLIKFTNGEYINIQADCIDLREGWIYAWRGDYIVAIVKADEVSACYISEKKEG